MFKYFFEKIAKCLGFISFSEHKFLLSLVETMQREKYFEDRKQIQVLTIETEIGKPFISVTNEWDNPTIGIVLGVEYITAGNCPIAVVYDFVSNHVIYCGNSRLPFTYYNLDAILKIDPYQRWNLIAKSSLESDKVKSNPDCFSANEILEILKLREFDKVIEELNALHFTQTALTTAQLIDRVIDVMKSNNLNLEVKA